MNINTSWELIGIDPEPLREAQDERARDREETIQQRREEYERDHGERRARAEEQMEPFRRRLSQILGAEVPEEAIQVVDLHSKFEVICELARIPETQVRELGDLFEKTIPGRLLTAVWEVDDQKIHIRVTGLEDDSDPYSRTWNAGPIDSVQDLMRIIERRGNDAWTPPEPEPAPEPAPEPRSADVADARAREILERLSVSPRNHRGLIGALIALAWSNLATRQN